jgi:hypothetical protein
VSDSVHAPKLFISYRREETPVSAAWLYEVLVERFGEPNVFMDLKFKPGENFVKRTSEVVGACHILLVVMGPHWAAPEGGDGPASIKDPDDFVRLETEIAMERNDVSVLPVLVGAAKMPHPDELPDKIRGLTDIQAKQLTNERRAEDMKELVGRVEELLPPETVVHRVPRPTGPSRPAKKREPKDERRPWWQIAVAAVAAVAVAAVVLVATGALSGGSDRVTYPLDEEVRDLDVRGPMVALTKKGADDSVSTLSRLDLSDGSVRVLVHEAAKYNGIDVGTDARGHATVVVSRCKPDDDCDVYRLQGSQLVRRYFATSTCKAVRPSMADGRILFSRGPPTCKDAGLWITGGDKPDRISPAGGGADLNGRVVADLLDPSTISVYKVSDDSFPQIARLGKVGERLWKPPVVVDGEYVYFVDDENSSYYIARIDHTADDPVLEHYGTPAEEAPHFGVASGSLYATGLPGAGNRVIVRDDDPDPDFKDVDGAVRKF